VGKRFADVNIVDRVTHDGVMVWAGISYRQQTELHFFAENVNAQRYLDDILRLIVTLSFNRHHHLMFQHDNTLPQVSRVCTQFLEAENFPVLPWPATHLTCYH
jgi:hypothetical protein